jgi:hypothetical protein
MLFTVGITPARANTGVGGSESTVTVAADRGWQSTGRDLHHGQSFTVTYKSGAWTVGSPGLPMVGMDGYDDATDEGIYQGCKILNELTYGHLLVRTGNSAPMVVARSGTYTAPGAGNLEFRINDDDRCLGDNAGALTLSVTTDADAGPAGEDQAGVVQILQSLCPDLNTSDGAWHCKTLVVAIFNSPPCVARILADTVITYYDYAFALTTPPCLLVFGPAMPQLVALWECDKVYHDVRVCLGMRPPSHSRMSSG